MADATWWDVPESEYHADFSRVSHHMLEEFRASVPRYCGLYVARTIPSPPPTAAMILGGALHCLLLEPTEFASRFVVPPKCDKRTKAGKARWQEFLDDTAGLGLRHLDADDYELVQAMRSGVMENGYARDMVASTGKPERAIRWTDHGVLRRGKPDKVNDAGLVIDPKTTDGELTPAAWGATVAKYGLHRQAATYLDVVNELMPDVGAGPFVWLVISKKPPHETAVYCANESMLAIARNEIAASLAELKDRTDSNNWSSRFAGKILECELPRWAAVDPVPY